MLNEDKGRVANQDVVKNKEWSMRIKAGTDLGGEEHKGHVPVPPPPTPTPIFLQIKNFAQAKIQKYNIKENLSSRT